MATPSPVKRQRLAFTAAEKRAICIFHGENPKISQRKLADHFSAQWNKDVRRRTICDILKDKNVWLSMDHYLGMSKKVRPAKHEAMETELFMWLMSERNDQTPVSREGLRRKAMSIGEKLGIVNFTYSPGWLNRFKHRFGLSNDYMRKENVTTVDHLLHIAPNQADDVLNTYRPKNIFYLTVCGLFFRLPPDKSLINESFEGSKKFKSRISVALCVNSDGSEKCKMLIIGPSNISTCFSDFNVNLYCDYDVDDNSLMTGIRFNDWLNDFNEKMKSESRKVLLLVDRIPSHAIHDNDEGETVFSNLRVVALHSIVTGVTHSVDSGIVQNFKVNYRRLQVQYLLDCMDCGRSLDLSVADAIRFAKFAWDLVAPDTIRRFFPRRNQKQLDMNKVNVQSISASDVIDLSNLCARLANALNIDSIMTPEEFVNSDREILGTSMMDDSEMFNMLLQPEQSDDNQKEEIEAEEDHVDVTAEMKPITSLDARMALGTVQHFLERYRLTDEGDIEAINRLRSKIDYACLFDTNHH